MTSTTPLPFKPIAVALETIKLEKRSDDVKLSGIDLESGRRVKIKVHFVDDVRTSTDPISDLVILLSLERLLP
ncbi:hypothetical protein [Brevundimonas sp.]|uniref:hypothetical protein n=1 Tax=Brevundimonas sp. TaxID=1871086 RepID=UPI002D701D40|nr:hypothetical protein [Brevundimonas sp.]HYC68902.1 hypothetical protein [Brevundimonas sp.]